MKLSEQIKRVQAQILLKSDALTAIVAKGMDMSDDELIQAEAIKAEVKGLEGRLVLLKDAEAQEAAAATAVNAKGVVVTPTSAVSVTPNVQKGSAFVRTAMILAKSKGNLALAESLAEKHFKDDAVVNGIVKAAVSAGTTQVAAWAGNLIYPEQYAADFIELLYPQTVLGRLSLRKVPFNVRISSQTQGTAVGWVGEAQPAPVTSAGFDKVFLTWAKAYGIAVMSDELIRFSNPAAEALVQADLVKALAKGLDLSFLGTQAAVANVSPAGMLNGVTAVPASGTDALSLIKDIQTLVAPLIAANIDLTGAKLLMSPARALAIGSMRNSLGNKYFPDMSQAGGTLENFPVLTSNNVSGSAIVLLVPDEIYLSEDAGPQIDISTEASIIMDTNPAGAGTVQPVSMFQNSEVAIRIGQFINWQARRPGLCAQYISGAAYA
ncbi:phage major capsid protein [Burkholderia cenocepacia]|nr:phage major capsid protein [Burkholderia cenocepacia]